MELRTLQYFLSVAQEENISRAAETLHLTQPTLSRQMMDLEEEFGKKLLIRGKRRVTLTEEGMLLRKRAREMLDLMEKTRSEIKSTSEAVAGEIRIGSGETYALHYLTQTAGELRSRYPDIHLHISSGDGFDIMEELEKGLVDFAVFIGEVDVSRYDSIRLPMDDISGVLMPKEHPLAAKEAISPRDLWDQPLLLSRQVRDGTEHMQWFQRNMEQLNVVGTYSLIYNASLMVEDGLGLAVGLDKLINTTGDSPLCFRPLTPEVTVHIFVAWKKYQVFSAAGKKFLELLQTKFGDAEPLQ